MIFAIILGFIVCVAALLLTIQVGKSVDKEDVNDNSYDKSTGQNTLRLSAIYVIVFIATLVILGAYLMMK